MSKRNLNIPAVLVHNVDGVLYRVNGVIVDVNESAITCSMKFNGYPILDGIPMESVYLNEGFIDTIKDYGKAALNTIKKVVKKVAGLLLPVDEEGNPDWECITHPFNILAHGTNDAILMWLPDETAPAIKSFMSGLGIKAKNTKTISEGFAVLEAREGKEAETMIARVQNTYIKNDGMTVSEAFKFVMENYYASSINNNSLNESTVSLHNLIGDLYGTEYHRDDLVGLIMRNVKGQISGTFNSPNKTTKPLLIWGAPGIGKTSVIKQALRRMKERQGIDLAIEEISASNITQDGLVIPDTFKNIKGMPVSSDVPKLWLPVYRPAVDLEVWKDRDDYYNSGLYRYTEADLKRKDGSTIQPKLFDGGVIFIDEFSRMNPKVSDIMMGLINERRYLDLTLASKWGYIMAANRFYDIAKNPKEDYEELAKIDRRMDVTYVPLKSEWLEWAREINVDTGTQHVDEMYCDFIENTPDYVWYDALDLGARDNQLTSSEVDAIAANANAPLVYKQNTAKTTYDNLDAPFLGGNDTNYIRDMKRILTDSRISTDKHTWTPRDWAEAITPNVNILVLSLFQEAGRPELAGDPEKIKEIGLAIKDGVADDKLPYDGIEGVYNRGNIDMSLLNKALAKLTPDEYKEMIRFSAVPKAYRNNRMTAVKYLMDREIVNLVGQEGMPYIEWQKYGEFKRVFNPKVCESIWNTGKMGNRSYDEDDALVFESPADYIHAGTAIWKRTKATQDEVIDLLLNHYPGGINGLALDCATDLIKINKAAPLTDAEYGRLFDKWIKRYSFDFGDKLGGVFYFLWSPDAKFDEEDMDNRKNVIISLENSTFAQRFANFCMYIAKASIQGGCDAAIGELLSKVIDDAFLKKLPLLLYNKVIDINNVTLKDTDTKRVSSKLMMCPGETIINNTSNRNNNFAAYGEY